MSLLIFGSSIAGICTLVLSLQKAGDLARDHYSAINLAKNRVERAQTFDFDRLPSFAEAETVIDENGSPDSGARFRRTTTVTFAQSNLVEFVVTVAIRSRDTGAFDDRQEALRTYVSHMPVGPPEEW